MNEKDLMRAMTDMNEEFIEEAEKAVNKSQYASFSKTGKSAGDAEYIRIRKPKKRFWKWAGGIAAALAVCVIGAGVFGGMGGGSKSAYRDEAYYVSTPQAAPTAAMPASAAGGAVSNGYSKGSDLAAEAEGWDMPEPSEPDMAYVTDARSHAAGQTDKANMKLIYRANMSLQTTDYDATEAQIKAMAESFGGYIQDSSFNTGGYYNSGNYKEGYFTIRIPAEHYKEFVNAVGDSCHVTNISESIEDIGLEYYEVEARLETLRTKEKRLQELLKEAAGLSDIIQLESALSDTEYEIDLYTSQLNRYDSLVGYSTISISLQQVEKPSDEVKQDNSFGARLSRAFERGWDNFVDSIEWFIIDLSYSIFGIITFVIIAAALFFIIRAIVRKTKKKKLAAARAQIEAESAPKE